MHEHEHWHFIASEDLDSAKYLFIRSSMTTLFFENMVNKVATIEKELGDMRRKK